MHACRSLDARRTDGKGRLRLSLRSLLSAAAVLCLGLIAALALAPAAQAGSPPVTFCQVTGLSACAGPVTAPSQNITGSRYYFIVAWVRMRALNVSPRWRKSFRNYR